MRDDRGASTAEFALVLVPFLALLLGFFNLCAVMYFNSTMQNAVEDSVRWASVQTVVNGTAPSSGSVQTHFNARYSGPTTSTFNYNSSASESNCSGSGSGSTLYHQVTARATYNINAVVAAIPVTLRASACFPKA